MSSKTAKKSIFAKKMPRDIFENTPPPPCVFWWHSREPRKKKVSRIIWMAPYIIFIESWDRIKDFFFQQKNVLEIVPKLKFPFIYLL